VLPAGGPEDSQRSGFPFRSPAHGGDARRKDGGFAPNPFDRLEGLKVRHAPQQGGQGLQERVAVKGGVEPDRAGRQGAGHIGQGELIVALAFDLHRIGQLVFVEIDEAGQIPDPRRGQAEELGQVEHSGAEQQVPPPPLREQWLDLAGERHGRVPHAPLPFVGGQRQDGPLVPTGLRPAVEKGLMTAAVIGFERENPHRGHL
jgi:hypothetical protein